MNYKFYIYKQSNLTNFNKYDLGEYILLREITQNSKWGLKIERDREWFTVIRRKFSGNVTVKGADFDALILTEGDVKQYAVVIHRECAGVYTEFWKGFFSYFDFKVNLDTCYLSFEPTVWDKYTPVYDQMTIDRNILVVNTTQTVLFVPHEWETESISHNEMGLSLPAAAAYAEYAYAPVPVVNKYYLYSQTAIFLEWVPDGSGGFWPLYDINQVYKREIAYAVDNITPPIGFGINGVPVEEVQPGLWKWARPVGNMAYTLYTYVTSGLNSYEELIMPPAGTQQGLIGCITLKSVLEFYADFFSLTYVSDFFNDTPCPVGGDTLQYTMLQQISNLRDVMDYATKGMMKLKDLLTWLRDTFNVYWYVDVAGDWRLEHRRYFDTGLSYTIPAAIEVDIHASYPLQTLKLNKYEWEKPELVRFEELNIPFSYFSDWVDAKIDYSQLSILGNETKTLNVEWGTDLLAMYSGRDELPKQGWVLLDCYQTIPIKKVRNTVGALTGKSYTNARFSTANLMRDLWTWGRLLPTGNVNGVLTTFDSVERLRKQVILSIPQCCQDWDYEGLYRTELGDGIIDSAEYEQNGTLKVNLIYE